jgi:hypothetical protein
MDDMRGPGCCRSVAQKFKSRIVGGTKVPVRECRHEPTFTTYRYDFSCSSVSLSPTLGCSPACRDHVRGQGLHPRLYLVDGSCSDCIYRVNAHSLTSPSIHVAVCPVVTPTPLRSRVEGGSVQCARFDSTVKTKVRCASTEPPTNVFGRVRCVWRSRCDSKCWLGR